MIPKIVKFTGLEILPQDLNRRVNGPIPNDWTRHQFLLDENHNGFTEWALSSWINKTLHGRWAIKTFFGANGITVVLGFEDGNDAVMFRLLEGETAWQTPNQLI